jgi:hypothetical protein
MAISFPASPSLNQQYSYNGRTWSWNGTYWQSIGTIQGTVGTQGLLGIQGTQGLNGLFAAQGIQGTAGFQGLQGGGFNQSQGIQGLQGNSGFIGSNGFQGIQGLQGFGYAQLQGLIGFQGTQGIQGAQGTQGFQGSQGLQGLQGGGFNQLQGTQGAQGHYGIQGSQGLQGIQGIQGFSIQGVQGVQGLISAQGFQGIQGGAGTVPATSYALLGSTDFASTNASTYTFSGLSGYNKYYIVGASIYTNTAGANWNITFNGDTGSNYLFGMAAPAINQGQSGYIAGGTNGFGIYNYSNIFPSVLVSRNNFEFSLEINGANSASGKKAFFGNVSGYASEYPVYIPAMGYISGVYNGTSTISSITLTCSSTMSNGQIYLWGSN